MLVLVAWYWGYAEWLQTWQIRTHDESSAKMDNEMKV